MDWQAVGQVIGGVFGGLGLALPLVAKMRREIIGKPTDGLSLREVIDRIDERLHKLGERVAVLEERDAGPPSDPPVQH